MHNDENIEQQCREFITKTHGSLVISNGKWIWNQGQHGGVSALDYLMKVRGVGFVETVETLMGERAATARSYQDEAKKRPPPIKRPFSPPRQLRFATYAVSYLQDRGIHPDIISRCIRSGLIYEGRHDSMAVCVFVGRDENGRERFACMRGLFGDLKRDGYVINLDLSDVRELVTLLRYCSNNLNQYAKRANETGSVYAADIEDLCSRFDGLWDSASGIMSALADLK